MLRNWKASLAMALMAAMGSASAWAYEHGTYFVADEAAAAASAGDYKGGPYQGPHQGPYQGPAQAPKGGDVVCDHCAPPDSDDPVRLFQNDGPIQIYGWINGGVTANSRPTADRYNGVQTFNDRREGQLNQLYLVAEKAIDTESCDWQIGGRVDLMYGTDFIFNQMVGWELTPDGDPRWNAGQEQYGFVTPQAYIEVGNALNSFKIGRFYTIIGYEVVPAPGNFFYSHAYTMQYGEPFFHSGVLYTRTVNDNLSLNFGVVNGWDAWDRNPSNQAGILAGFAWNNGDGGTSIALAGIFSNEPDALGDLNRRDMYSLVISQELNECWTYVFQHDLGKQVAGSNFDAGATAEWYGINQYLFRKLNDCWTVGFRGEWFRDDDGFRVTGIRPGNAVAGEAFAGNFYQLTFGANYKPNNNVIFRPELRYDWFDGVSAGGLRPYDAGTRDDQLTAAIDVIVQW